MRVSVHFDTNSDEFAYFVRTGQLALGPPHPAPVNSFRPPSFHSLQPHPSVLEFPHQPASVQNGWDPQPQPLPPAINGWGEPERKDQLIIPPLSVASGNEVRAHNNDTEASSSTLPVHSSTPLQLNIADHPVFVEQPVDNPHVELPVDLPADLPLAGPSEVQPVVTSDAVEATIDGEVSISSVIPELKPAARSSSLSRLSLFPKLFQQLHDYGLF
jgi:hypothetical protein